MHIFELRISRVSNRLSNVHIASENAVVLQYRIGYYGGVELREVQQRTVLRAVRQRHVGGIWRLEQHVALFTVGLVLLQFAALPAYLAPAGPTALVRTASR